MADAPAPAPSQVDKLDVKLFSPYQVFYQGLATSVSAVNKTGPFDVLYNHANFFTLLVQGEVSVDTGYQKMQFPISRGVMKVTNNRMTIFMDI